ncbi:UNVERIFIED_CONTAM: hypothetical protein Sradi_0223800 [Sesamum radiatum]|uniref:Uncharacterized protein n=1 Tax=Sesamum radiatum TaxID=300843 RepID=A0AAW2VZI0_SESRA
MAHELSSTAQEEGSEAQPPLRHHGSGPRPPLTSTPSTTPDPKIVGLKGTYGAGGGDDDTFDVWF